MKKTEKSTAGKVLLAGAAVIGASTAAAMTVSARKKRQLEEIVQFEQLQEMRRQEGLRRFPPEMIFILLAGLSAIVFIFSTMMYNVDPGTGIVLFGTGFLIFGSGMWISDEERRPKRGAIIFLLIGAVIISLWLVLTLTGFKPLQQ